MSTETNTPKTLADFAPALLQALRNLTHPMASDDDLHDAVELLGEIDAARKAVSDAAFVKAASATRTNGKRILENNIDGTPSACKVAATLIK